MSISPQDVLSFWFDEVGYDRWYAADPALDAMVAKRFGDTWNAARRGRLRKWEATHEGALALVIVLDQFPRNMFRGDARAFSSDIAARKAANRALELGFDLLTPAKRRTFFYLPFMHSEKLSHQDRCVALVKERLAEDHSNLPYALRHRELIARFGRFPWRNAALGRISTPAEREFLADQETH